MILLLGNKDTSQLLQNCELSFQSKANKKESNEGMDVF